MTQEFTIDVFEQKKDLLFVTGIALTELQVGVTVTQLFQYGKNQKSKKRLKTLNLTIETLIVNGEPVEEASAEMAVMVALSGDATAIEETAKSLKWRRKSGRMLRTSDIALTLATE